MKMKKSNRLIEGVEIKELKKILTFDFTKKENGWLVDILRASDPIKKDRGKFAQLYMTTAFPGKVKGFHWTRKKSYLLCAVYGKAKLVIIDDRKGSPTYGLVNEIMMQDADKLVRIPPLVKRGFKNTGKTLLVMINCVDKPYTQKDPDIYDSREDYEW